MRKSVSTLVAAMALITAAAAKEPRRGAGAHVHGTGSLDIAIEGNKVVMEFKAPGEDITGSEAKAVSPRAKATLAAALATLEKPLALFKLPDAAGCTVTSAKAAAVDDDDHDQAAKPAAGKGKSAKSGHDHKHDTKAEHMEIKATYELACTAPAQITALQFDYFGTFPRAQKVTIQVITAKGQTQFEATRVKPRIELGGLM